MVILEVLIKNIPWLWLFQQNENHSINFNNFASLSFHDFDFSEKIKITSLVSLLFHHFHCMTLVVRKNENHSMTFINFASFSFHDFHNSKKMKIIPWLSLVLYPFHCMILIFRDNENHSMTFINFASFSSHDFDTLDTWKSSH